MALSTVNDASGRGGPFRRMRQTSERIPHLSDRRRLSPRAWALTPPGGGQAAAAKVVSPTVLADVRHGS
jgi:hypothetical protein